jgi:predicted Zn-dependent protease with MMP-like domain
MRAFEMSCQSNADLRDRVSERGASIVGHIAMLSTCDVVRGTTSQTRNDCAGGVVHVHLYALGMFEMSNERFEELASEALDSLPEDLAVHIENLVVVVDDQASGRSLYGLYEGVPLTKRGTMSYSAVLPDRITLYQTTICRSCNNEAEVIAQIRKTVIHEVAHHFGISDPRLDELGWA